ncbi:hypothetical protein Tco_0292119 [Tanacetum coccineum]
MQLTEHTAERLPKLGRKLFRKAKTTGEDIRSPLSKEANSSPLMTKTYPTYLFEKRYRSAIRIQNFVFPKKIPMPSNVKIYDRKENLRHLQKIQTPPKVDSGWAMPRHGVTCSNLPYCAARLWFDELPPESIGSFVELQKAFLA